MNYTKEQAEQIFPDVIFEGDCYIGKNVFIANNVRIGNNCQLKIDSYIGKDSYIGDNTIIECNVAIMDTSIIGSNCHILENTKIKAQSFIGNDTTISKHESDTLTIYNLYDFQCGSWYCQKRGIVIKLGCAERTLNEWHEYLFNNGTKIMSGEINTNYMKLAFMTCSKWSVMTFGEGNENIEKFNKQFKLRRCI